MNFLMFKLVLEKAEDPKINCQHPLDHAKASEFQKNIYFCFIDYAQAFECVDHNKLWEILKEMGIPDHLTCLLGNLYAGRKQKLELDMEQQTGSKLGEEYVNGVYSHLAYLTYMQSSVQFSSVTQSCATVCYPMDRSTLGLPVHHQLPEFTQIHVH